MRVFLSLLGVIWILAQAHMLAADEPLRVLVMGDSFKTSNGSSTVRTH